MEKWFKGERRKAKGERRKRLKVDSRQLTGMERGKGKGERRKVKEVES
jgi:hypothetical protein